MSALPQSAGARHAHFLMTVTGLSKIHLVRDQSGFKLEASGFPRVGLRCLQRDRNGSHTLRIGFRLADQGDK